MMRAVLLMKAMATKAMKSMAMKGKGKLKDGRGKRRGSRANARGRVSLTSGMKVEPAHMKRHGRPTLPEAPGPAYTDPALGGKRALLRLAGRMAHGGMLRFVPECVGTLHKRQELFGTVDVHLSALTLGVQ